MELFAVYSMPWPLQREDTESKLVHFSMARMFLQRVFISVQYFFEMETLYEAELDLVIKNCHSNRKFLMRESWEEIWFIYGQTCCGYILKWLVFRVTIQCTSQPDLSCFFWSIENYFPRLSDKPPYFPRLSGMPPSFGYSHFSDVVFATVEHLGLINQELYFLHCRCLTSAEQSVHQE